MQKFKNQNQVRGPGQINRSGSGGGSPIGQIRGTNGNSSPMSNPTVPNGSANAQAQSNAFSSTGKMNNRLRGRNPVFMSMQGNQGNGSSGNSTGPGSNSLTANATGQPHVLMPLSQRSLSPNSYQQLQQHQQLGNTNAPSPPSVIVGNAQGNSRKAGSLNRKLHGVNSSGGHGHFNEGSANHHKSLNSPTSLVGGHSIHGRDGLQEERSGGGSRGAHMALGSHHGPLGQLTSPTNQFGGVRERGNSHGGYHNFHPMQPEQQSNGNNTGHSIVHGQNHFPQFNVKDQNASQGHSRHVTGNSLESINLMQSNDSQINTVIKNQANNQQNPQNGNQIHQVVQLNKKILGNRKRNAREKSYDSYNQKLQLPPMIKTPQDRSDRTYSVPNHGNIGGMSGPGNAAANNILGSSNAHHQYMLPLSPGGSGSPTGMVGGSGHHVNHNSITPKTTTHAQMQQRQSINEGLMSGQNNQGVNSSVNGNQMFTRFSNIQLQNSISKNGKISGQGGRAFQSVNNFFNPRTAGAQKHPHRERISTHHFQHGNEISSPHHHPMSPGASIGGTNYGPGGSNSRIGGSSINADSTGTGNDGMSHHQPGGIFLKNTFSPRMKIGQPPGSSGLGGSTGLNSSAQNHNTTGGGFQMGAMSGGPVKAAHHNRPGMGGSHARNSGGAGSGSSPAGGAGGGALDDSRQSPNHSFNAQGTSLHHSIHSLAGGSTNSASGASAPGGSGSTASDAGESGGHHNQRSSPANRVKAGHHGQHHRGGAGSSSGQPSGNSAVSGSQASNQNQHANSSIQAGGSRSRQRPQRQQNANASLSLSSSGGGNQLNQMPHGGAMDSRSVATPQNETLSTADSSSKQMDNQQSSEDGQRFQIPTPLSSEEQKDSNIQFVEVQTLLFGENPAALNPKTIQLKNHEPTKASQKKCGIIKSYAANTNQGIIRDYNEDRVSIILNILKPKNKANIDIDWPQICFFGVFDGHGGSACADYLRDNLHNFVVQNEQFPQNPIEAINQGFRECERNFLSLVEQAQARAQTLMTGQNVGPERSGSCATVVMIIDDMVYVINVGDSRAMMSIDAGSKIGVLTRDHKPDDELEKIRIQAAGGKIYRTQTFAKAAAHPGEKDLYVQGPLRVFPGRLSVSKTFGDIEAKRPRYGGNPNVIVCDPDIKSFKIQDNFDFIMIGCDGIFERLSNRDCIDGIWDQITDQIQIQNKMGQGEAYKGGKRDESKKRGIQNSTANNRNSKNKNVPGSGGSQYNEHQAAADGVEIIIRGAAASRSLDNITSLILGLKGLKKTIQKLNCGQELNDIRSQIGIERQGIKNTYLEDFAFLEGIDEPESGVLNEAINIANSTNSKQHVSPSQQMSPSNMKNTQLNQSKTTSPVSNK